MENKYIKEAIFIENNVVDAKQLKKILNNKVHFKQWINTHIRKNNLKKDIDYILDSSQERYFFTYNACIKILESQYKNKTANSILEKIKNGRDLVEIIDSATKQNDISILKIEDEEYPKQLRKIQIPPKQLYIMGDIKNLKEKGIAVVGSRNCSNYGRKICKIFTNNLVGYGLIIISGLATGIDSCAHKTCIESNGKTIAVLPSGFDNIFPKENELLVRKIIANGGTVITEYPPEYKKNQESCRERNRIMSGLAIGTLVVEAEQRSGTSITVRYTNEQNKKAFCIPSSLFNSKGVGTNEMLRQNRAQMVTKVEDIINEFPELKLEKRQDFKFLGLKDESEKETKIKKQNPPKIEEENLEVYNLLTKNIQEVDEMANILNKPVSEISYKLTMLELEGAIEKIPGNKYKIK